MWVAVTASYLATGLPRNVLRLTGHALRVIGNVLHLTTRCSASRVLVGAGSWFRQG
jgi:hypothetical protein